MARKYNKGNFSITKNRQLISLLQKPNAQLILNDQNPEPSHIRKGTSNQENKNIPGMSYTGLRVTTKGCLLVKLIRNQLDINMNACAQIDEHNSEDCHHYYASNQLGAKHKPVVNTVRKTSAASFASDPDQQNETVNITSNDKNSRFGIITTEETITL